jgi:nucleotide-binding universal stress UspA family protein
MLNFNSEHFFEQEQDYTTERRLLLGIDAPITGTTMYLLHTVGAFFMPYSEYVHIQLVTVIPVPVFGGGRYGPPRSLPPTVEQRRQVRTALKSACLLLEHYGISPAHIEMCVLEGAPADELVKLTTKQHIDCLLIGSQGYALGHWLRRIFLGSLSHSVLHYAACPVMVVKRPRARKPIDLVNWYEETVRQMLRNRSGALVNITASDVAGTYAPLHGHISGSVEKAAAARALDRLAEAGVLCRHAVDDEIHYIND